MMTYIVYFNEKQEAILKLVSSEHDLSQEEVIKRLVPLDTPYYILDNLPSSLEFQKAWEVTEENKISVNLEKAKNIAHEERRLSRAKEFAPYDSIIAKQIPNETEKAEQERALIRAKYDEWQTNIDQAEDLHQLNTILCIIRKYVYFNSI